MRFSVVEITLADLQEALIDFCFKKGCSQPDQVVIVSHSKSIHVELHPGGRVEADAFLHRAYAE